MDQKNKFLQKEISLLIQEVEEVQKENHLLQEQKIELEEQRKQLIIKGEILSLQKEELEGRLSKTTKKKEFFFEKYFYSDKRNELGKISASKKQIQNLIQLCTQ